MKPRFVLTVFLFFSLSCDLGEAPQIQQGSLVLTILETHQGEVWLQIQTTQGEESSYVKLERDGRTLYGFTSVGADSKIYADWNVQPGKVYSYRAVRKIVGGAKDSTDYTLVRTHDTTSSQFQWTVNTLGTAQSYVKDLWGNRGNNVYAVGQFYGATSVANISRWDGADWEYLWPELHSAGLYAGDLLGVYGIDDNNVWVAGFGWTSNPFRDSTFGFVGRWDGMNWRNISPHAAGIMFWDVWAASPSDVWVCGTGGAIYRYDGSSWLRIETGVQYDLRRIWGFGGSDIYASGGDHGTAEGVLIHYDGHSWLPYAPSILGNSIPRGVWGATQKFFFVAGSSSVYRKRVEPWWNVSFPGTVALERLEGEADNNIAICGHYGRALHWNGIRWTPIGGFYGDPGTVFSALAVFDTDIFVGGSSGFDFDIRGIVVHGRR